MTKDEAFEKFWNTEIVSDVTGNIDTAMWGNIDRNDTAFIFMAGFKACKEALEQPTNMVTIPLDKLEDMQRRLKEQPTQEPVAYFKKWEDKSGEHKDIKFSNSEGYKPLYTHPAPQPTTQEPVAWMHCVDEDITEFNDFQACPKCEPLYTHPKEWQGLTAEEIASIPLNENTVQAVENLLREKNG